MTGAVSDVTGRLKVGEVFARTASIVKGSFGKILTIALILLVPWGVFQALTAVHFGFSLVAVIADLVFSSWLAGAMVVVAWEAQTGVSVDRSPIEIIRSVSPRLVALILVKFIVTILTLLGLVLLIVPGLIVTAMWAVAVPVLIIEGLRAEASLSRSSDLTRGNRMGILGIALIMIASYLVSTLIFLLLAPISLVLSNAVVYLAAVLIYPFISLLVTVLYFRLVELREGASFSAAA